MKYTDSESAMVPCEVLIKIACERGNHWRVIVLLGYAITVPSYSMIPYIPSVIHALRVKKFERFKSLSVSFEGGLGEARWIFQ